MELLLSQPASEPETTTPSFPGEQAEALPLSFAQQRLWFLDQLQPESPRYNVPAAFHLRGELNIEAMQESLRLIVARHEILRTVYLRTGDEPSQRILEEAKLEVPVVDLTRSADPKLCPTYDKVWEDLRQRLARQAAIPFDLENGLMLRAAIFKLADNDHVLFLNTHHIAFDEWSMHVLWRELAANYAALRDNRAPDLEELPIQYADFALWQRDKTESVSASETYWRERLSGDLARLELPTKKNVATARTERGAREFLIIPSALLAQLKHLTRSEGVTMHVLLLAAFQILLRRYCAQDDVIIGMPVAGRTHFQTEPLIGFFVNTLPVRVSFAGNPSFRELLQRARQACLEACDHQDLPFDQIVELVHAPRRPNQNPIFDIVFSSQHGAGATWDFGGLKVEPIEVDTATAKFDLTFVAQDRGEDLAAVIEYSVDLFDSEMIRQMLDCYLATLGAIVAHPEAAVFSLSLPAASAPAAASPKAAAHRIHAVEMEQPQTRFQRRLHEIWKNVLGHNAFGPTDDFFEIGGHSLLAVKLIAQVEKTFGKRLPLPILFRAPTIEKMAEALAETISPAFGSCLVEIQPRGEKPPVFWLHTLGGGGGGGLFTYRKLAEALGPDQPSYGFVASAQPFDNIEAMAARYIQEMRGVQPTGPYRLGGYCFGGVVAYEMARQLEAAGVGVATLALLDSSPPDPTGERSRPGLKLAWHALTALPAWLLQLDKESIKKNLQRLRARLSKLRARADSTTTIDSIDSPAKLEEFVDMTHYPADYRRFAQAHWKALMNYKPGPYRGPATLFKTDERHLFRMESVGAWRQLIGSNLEIRRITGKHEQILEDPHVAKLAAQLSELLNQPIGA